MTSLPSFTLNEIRRKLTRLGFKTKRSKGKHEMWAKGGFVVAISHGNQQVGKSLLKSICHQAHITIEELSEV